MAHVCIKTSWLENKSVYNDKVKIASNPCSNVQEEKTLPKNDLLIFHRGR